MVAGCGSVTLMLIADSKPAFHFNGDPDPASLFDVDPNPAPDPDPHPSDGNLGPLVYRPSRTKF
jgi:hypothetical protein